MLWLELLSIKVCRQFKNYSKYNIHVTLWNYLDLFYGLHKKGNLVSQSWHKSIGNKITSPMMFIYIYKKKTKKNKKRYENIPRSKVQKKKTHLIFDRRLRITKHNSSLSSITIEKWLFEIYNHWEMAFRAPYITIEKWLFELITIEKRLFELLNC
jgi:hypothetical protein